MENRNENNAEFLSVKKINKKNYCSHSLTRTSRMHEEREIHGPNNEVTNIVMESMEETRITFGDRSGPVIYDHGMQKYNQNY